MININNGEVHVQFSGNVQKTECIVNFERILSVDSQIDFLGRKSSPALVNGGAYQLIDKHLPALNIQDNKLLSVEVRSDYPVLIKLAINDINLITNTKLFSDHDPRQVDYLISNRLFFIGSSALRKKILSYVVDIQKYNKDSINARLQLIMLPMKSNIGIDEILKKVNRVDHFNDWIHGRCSGSEIWSEEHSEYLSLSLVDEEIS